MRVLLDTNIIIHREASNVVIREIGTLFNWLDRLHYEKCVHPLSIDEIRKHRDARVVATFETKIDSYHILKITAPESPQIQAIRAKYDKNDNDRIDTSLLKEVFADRVDILITEDRKVHEKANALGISTRVFTIDTFLEKVVAENPDLVDYRVLSVKKDHFGNLNIADSFFESFKSDYHGFEQWFNRKAEEIAYVCKGDNSDLLAFLYVKVENTNENYSDIEPAFTPKRRLKVGTFKVIANGFKLGERFLKIIFDNAMQYRVEEIYLTIFDRTEDQQRLINLIHDWGFQYHGIKRSPSGEEKVFVRDFTPQVNTTQPRLTYPFVSSHTRKFIVPIYPQYHTELFPDSILRTESPLNFVENRPNRNAISKVYISRSWKRDLESGDLIIFYRTAANGPAYFTSVVTTLGVVEKVTTGIPNLKTFIEVSRKRSVFTDEELARHWNYNQTNHPFVVNFLYVYSFPKRLNLEHLIELGIIENSEKAPRGFEPLNDDTFQRLMESSNADQRFIVD
jgi:predicted nucleic acid-binding protein